MNCWKWINERGNYEIYKVAIRGTIIIDKPRCLSSGYTIAIDILIALGYPKEKSVIEEAIPVRKFISNGSRDSIKYYKDKNGKLHVPKRPLEKIVHINGW